MSADGEAIGPSGGTVAREHFKKLTKGTTSVYTRWDDKVLFFKGTHRVSSMHCCAHRYTHSNPPLDLDQLSGQVVKTSALESRSRGFKSRPSGL